MKTITIKLTSDEEKFYKKVISSSKHKNLIDAKKVYMDVIMRALATL
jgi:hypothetical protein